MAMTLASPSASPSPSTGDASTRNNNATTVKNESNNTSSAEDQPSTEAPATTTTTPATAAAAAAANVKRKPSRRANTAERRATHNAVERQRRETLNGRFLDLAQLLPNLMQIRRPSKSSIVNSSIAHIHASRRHRMLASRELRQLRGEADALRREVNEWRSRQNLPLVDEPVRSDGFNIIISGEIDVLVAEMGAEMAAQGHGNLNGINGAGLMDVEEDEDIDDWGPAPHSSHGGPPAPGTQGGYPGPGGQYDEEVFVPQPPVHHPQQQQQHHHQQQHPVHHQQGMMINGHHQQHHPMHHQQQHVPHPHHMAQQGHPFGYHPSQPQGPRFAPGSLEDDRFLKNGSGGNPFAHNVARSYDSPTGSAGALFTPPATRDGLPPNGVAGLTAPKINTNVGIVNGGASPAQSAHSAHSPASHHSGIVGVHPSGMVNGDGSTPPPPSAISQQFSARSGSGSPVGYELAAASHQQQQQPTMERRATYPGPGGPVMYGGEMGGYHPHGGHPGMHQDMRDMRGGHDMREMRGHAEMRHHAAMGGHAMGPGGGHHGGHEMRGHGQMVGAGAGGGGGLFGMMI